MKQTTGLFVGLVLLGAAGMAGADPVDHGAGVVAGGGVFGSHLSKRSYFGLVYDWPLPEAWQEHLTEGFRVRAEGNISRWWGCEGMDCGHVTDAGITPVFRFCPSQSDKTAWYLDFAVGVHLISRTSIGDQVYSTAFQFGEFTGGGILFGDEHHYDVGVRYMHESNADLKLPNDGMNFFQLQFALRW